MTVVPAQSGGFTAIPKDTHRLVAKIDIQKEAMGDIKIWNHANLLAAGASFDNRLLGLGYCAGVPRKVRNLSQFALLAIWLLEDHGRRATALKASSDAGFAP